MSTMLISGGPGITYNLLTIANGPGVTTSAIELQIDLGGTDVADNVQNGLGNRAIKKGEVLEALEYIKQAVLADTTYLNQ